MRGRWQAVAVAAGAGLVPLLGWLGAAVLALVTLRRGIGDGVGVALPALAGLGAVYWLLMGTPAPALQMAIELWAPVLLLAFWLRRTVSLAIALQILGVLGALAVVALHLMQADLHAYWREVMEAVLGGVPQDDATWQMFDENMLPRMTGFWAVGLMGAALLALLLGRWWQALLYNPGGFQAEFHGLDIGREAGILALVLVAAGMFTGVGLMADLALVASALFAVQAMALTHAYVKAREMSVAWLVAAYLMMPLVFQLVALVGIADALFKWRRRLGDPNQNDYPG